MCSRFFTATAGKEARKGIGDTRRAGVAAFAFVLGTVQGVVFQRSRSVVYPMVIHSFSNVVVTLIRFASL